jgi:hypothetical protein
MPGRSNVGFTAVSDVIVAESRRQHVTGRSLYKNKGRLRRGRAGGRRSQVNPLMETTVLGYYRSGLRFEMLIRRQKIVVR